jgi:hypothetical protein
VSIGALQTEREHVERAWAAMQDAAALVQAGPSGPAMRRV